jgi:hypothetical protein
MSTFYQITPKNHGWGLGNGFFSNYRVCLEQLILHHESKVPWIPYVSWAKTTFVEGFVPGDVMPDETENPFDFWFDQIIPSKDDTVIECTNRIGDTIDHAKDYFNDPVQLKRQQDVDRFYMRPKDHILKTIEDIYKNQLEGHTTLGIMARGAEYNSAHPMYGIFGTDDYIREIDIILAGNPQIDKLFIASEESEYVQKIHEAFPRSYFMPDVFRRTDETMEYIINRTFWANISTKRKDHCRLLGEETVIQTKLLGKCNYLFGRHCGVLAGAVLWGENIQKVFKI